MPKETIRENRLSDAVVEVRWGGEQKNFISVGVDLNKNFVFTGEVDPYTGLYVTLDTPEDVDALIRALRKAKRKTFGR